MSKYKYSTKMQENCARAVGVGLPISRKHAIMICQAIRGLTLSKAKRLLKDVTKQVVPIEYTRFKKGQAHRAGMAAGRYPIKACSNILMLLESAQANAQFKGLSTGNLIVRHASAQKGPTTMSFGRNRTLTKRAHVELMLEEKKQK